MVIFDKVSKIYDKKHTAVKDVSFHVEPGEFVSIVGQSGTGKSTILKLILAEIGPNKGKIKVGGWDITDIKHSEIPTLRRQLGVVFQDFKLIKKKTVYENVAFALQVCASPHSTVKKIVPQVLEIVGLKGKEDRFPVQLSGGEQQRVAIARALVHKPKLLLADEPTGNLDSITSKEIIDLLLKINSFGTTVILVTHDREVVNNIDRRVISMSDGKIIRDSEKGKYVI